MSESPVHGEPLERWLVTVPRQGPKAQDGPQGTPAFAFHLSPTASDQLEDSLRRLNPSTLRRGVPIIYRGDRQVAAEHGDDDERRVQLAHTTAQDPAEAADAYEVLQLRDLRRQLVLELDAKRRECESLANQIERQRLRLAEETARQDKLVEAVVAHGQKLVADSQTHYEARLRRTWETEADLDQHATTKLMGLGEQIDIATKARKQIDRVMTASSVAEVVGSMKETVEAAFNSPIGNSIGLGIAARLAASMSKYTKDNAKEGAPAPAPFEREDALAAMLMAGRQFRARQAMLRELRLASPTPRAEAAVLGADFLAGSVELRVLAEFVSAASPSP